MSVVKDLAKWLRDNAPNATTAERLLLSRAYAAGREHLLAAQARRTKQALRDPNVAKRIA